MARFFGSRVRRASRFRPLRLESLETRELLAADAIDAQWQNPIDRFDVNGDSRVAPSDALLIVNAMLANGRRRLIVPETGFAKGAYPDVKLDGIASRADFDMVLWELQRRFRDSNAGGGISLLSGDNQPPSATHGIANFLRWGESDETDTIFGWELFDDPDHDDTELNFSSNVSGDTNIIDTITFNLSTGEYDVEYIVGEWGTATVTLRATDPEGLYDEVSFEVTSVLVTGYDLEQKIQGSWTAVADDEGLLTDDELRGRAIFTTIPPEFVVPIAWKHKAWWDASDDLDAGDAVAGNWLYPLITAQYSDGAGGTWHEFQLVTEGDYGLTPEIDFGQFRYAAQMLPAKEKNVYKIQQPVWEGIELSDGQTNFEEDGNPSEYGGGDRFFAERNLPEGRTGSVLHEQVNLVVSVDRAVKNNQLIRLKLFDPDHYALPPFDINGTETAMAPKPDDNVAAILGGPVMGASFAQNDPTLLKKTVTIPVDQSRIKVPITILARQPSNNFKVAAYNPDIPDDKIIFGSDARTIVRDGYPTANVPQSPLLTIWRHLYVEVDSMGGPIFTRGPGPSHIDAGNILSVWPDRKTLEIDTNLAGINQYEDGLISLYDAADNFLGAYGVDGNTSGAGTSAVILKNPLPVDVALAAVRFEDLWDDDLVHGVDAEDMIPDLSLMASRYRPALIEVDASKADLSSQHSNSVNELGGIDFDMNLDTGAPNEDGIIIEGPMGVGGHRESATEPDFWSVYLLGAFQGAIDDDNDPDSEVNPDLGITLASRRGSTVFRETIRDTSTEEPAEYQVPDAQLFPVVVVHESGHQFQLIDNGPHGTIMDYDDVRAGPVSQLWFSLEGLFKIVTRDHPGGN